MGGAMRIKKVDYNNEESLIIYLTKDEETCLDIQNEIIEYKKIYKHVAKFISGDESMENALKKLIQQKM